MATVPFPSQEFTPGHAPGEDRELAREALALLGLRPVLLITAHLAAVLVADVGGASDPWRVAAGWWPVSGAVAALVGLVALQAHTARHGVSALALVRPARRHLRADAPIALLILALGLVSFVAPARPLAAHLLGGTEGVLAPWSLAASTPLAAVALVAWPVLTALVELPTLLGFVLPRLARVTRRGTDVVPAVAMALALQQAVLPPAGSWPHAAFRVLAVLPLSLVVTSAVAWRPRLLPWVAAVHAVLLALPFGVVLLAGS